MLSSCCSTQASRLALPRGSGRLGAGLRAAAPVPERRQAAAAAAAGGHPSASRTSRRLKLAPPAASVGQAAAAAVGAQLPSSLPALLPAPNGPSTLAELTGMAALAVWLGVECFKPPGHDSLLFEAERFYDSLPPNERQLAQEVSALLTARFHYMLERVTYFGGLLSLLDFGAAACFPAGFAAQAASGAWFANPHDFLALLHFAALFAVLITVWLPAHWAKQTARAIAP